MDLARLIASHKSMRKLLRSAAAALVPTSGKEMLDGEHCNSADSTSVRDKKNSGCIISMVHGFLGLYWFMVNLDFLVFIFE